MRTHRSNATCLVLRPTQQLRQLGDVRRDPPRFVARMSLVRDERHDRMDKKNDHSRKHGQRDSFIDACAGKDCDAFHSFPPSRRQRCTASVNEELRVAQQASLAMVAAIAPARPMRRSLRRQTRPRGVKKTNSTKTSIAKATIQAASRPTYRRMAVSPASTSPELRVVNQVRFIIMRL